MKEGKCPFDEDGRKLFEAFHRFKNLKPGNHLYKDMSQGEFMALVIISDYMEEYPQSEGIYVSDLAKSMRIMPSAVSRILKVLDEKNLVKRKVDEKDRRNTYVFLTEEGIKDCEKHKRIFDSYLQNIAKRLGSEKIEQISILCKEIASIMQEEQINMERHGRINEKYF